MTGVRYKVLGFTVALAAVTYLDRVCISRASGQIQSDLGLSRKQMGWVFGAFTIAYALFEVPSGAWGDRIGPRRVITRIVVWWSTLHDGDGRCLQLRLDGDAAVPVRHGRGGGVPECGEGHLAVVPGRRARDRAGVVLRRAHLGGGITPIVVGAMLSVMSWRWICVLFGLVGFVWARAWYRWFRDEPADHPGPDAAERRYIEAGRLADRPHVLAARRLGRVLADRNVIALCLMYFTQAYGFYFNLTWLPTYLEKARGFRDPALSLLAGLPLILSAAADLTGGLATDRLARAAGLRAGRCVIGGLSLLVAGTAMIAGAAVENPWAAALLIALAGAADSFLLGAAWGTCLDIAGRDAGLVTGAMNSAGQIGAFLSPLILPYFLPEGAEDWASPLYIAGGLYIAGAACWLFIDPRRPIGTDSAASRQG